MKENRVTRSYLLKSANKDYQPIVITYIISAVCHLGVFGILVFVPGYSPARKWSPSVVSVNLVSLPAPGPVSQREIPVEPEAPVEKVDQKVEKIPDPVVPKPVESKPVVVEKKPVKKVSISEKKRPFKPKKSLKKKTYKASKVIKSAINRIEKKTARKKTDPLANAMSNLRKKIASGRPSSSGGTGSGGGGKRALEQIDIYKIEIAFQIQKNWAFSTQLAGDRKDLETRLLIKIMSQGEIREIDFETKSGNTYFDESAYKAVQKSNPLPPLPRGYRRPFFIVGLRFTPSGLN
jgi:colicin import membrane protein